MSGLGAGIGIGLTILDRLLQAREAQKNEDVYRQLAEQHNLAAGTPSASQYQWSEGQDVHAPQAYSAPTLGTPTPAHSSFLDALINPRGVVERAGLFNALAEENQKQREAVAAKQREYLLGVQKMLLDKATPQALNPVEEEAKRATIENLKARTAQQGFYGQRAQAQANYFGNLLSMAGMPGAASQGQLPTGMPPDAQPLADINPNTGAVTPVPGQNLTQGDIRSIQDALRQEYGAQVPGTPLRGQPGLMPPRVPVVKGFGPSGPTIGMEVPPAYQAQIDAQKAATRAQATEQSKALPNETAAKMAEFDAVYQNANDIRQMVVRHPEFLGLERSGTAGLRETLGHGTIGPQESVFNGKINLIYAQLVRALQGARASDEDIKNFGKNIFPSAAIRDPEVFLARVDNAIDYVKNYSARYKALATTPRSQLRNESSSRPAPSGGTTWRWSGGKLVPQE